MKYDRCDAAADAFPMSGVKCALLTTMVVISLLLPQL